MGAQVFELAILLSLKDAASGKLDHVRDKLRATGKDGKATLQSFEELRKGLSRDLAIGGIGIAGLMLVKNGVQAAASYQSTITDLRSSITELQKDGSVNLIRLGDQMNRLDRLGMKLGNSLPGSTEDFLMMFTALKQSGLETETIINGAGEAVANLAVANRQVPKDIAVDLARFGQMFQLQPKEYAKAADLFSRIYTSKGIESSELIQGMKYFQGRAGTAFGLKGLEGAEQATRVLAFLRQRGGMEGSEVGTSAAQFFNQLASNKKALGELRKETGITLDIFDKGKFKGFDNAIQQLSKLSKLSQEQRIVFGTKIAGEQGAAILQTIAREGAEGWNDFNSGLNTTISMEVKVTEKAKDFNNQMEALQGTLSNLKVTAFQPMLGPLTRVAELSNTAVASVQGFASTHSTLTATGVGLFTIGSSGLVAYSGVRMLTTGWRLWKIVSAVGSHESGILNFFSNLQSQANSGATAIGNAGTKTAGLNSNLSVLSTLKFAGTVAGIAGVTYALIDTIGKAQELNSLFEKNKTDAQKNYDYLVSTRQLYSNQPVPESQISGLLKRLNEKNELTETLREQPSIFTSPEKFIPFMGEKNSILPDEYFKGSLLDIIKPKPYQGRINNLLNIFPTRGPGLPYEDKTAVDRLQRLIPEAHDPRVMLELVKSVRAGALGPEVGKTGIDEFQKLLGQFDPKAFQQASSQLELLSKSSEPVVTDFHNLYKATNVFTPSVIRSSNALDTFSFKLDNFTPSISIPAPYGPTINGGVAPLGAPALPQNKPFDNRGFTKSHASPRTISELRTIERFSHTEVVPSIIEPRTRRDESGPLAGIASFLRPEPERQSRFFPSSVEPIVKRDKSGINNSLASLRELLATPRISRETSHTKEIIHSLTKPRARRDEPTSLYSLASLLRPEPQRQALIFPSLSELTKRTNEPRLNTSIAAMREPKYEMPRMLQLSDAAISSSRNARGDRPSRRDESTDRRYESRTISHVNRRNNFYITEASNARATAREIKRMLERDEERS